MNEANPILIAMGRIFGLGLGYAFISMIVWSAVKFLYTKKVADSLYQTGYCIFTILTTVATIHYWNTEVLHIWLGYTIYLIIFFFRTGHIFYWYDQILSETRTTANGRRNSQS